MWLVDSYWCYVEACLLHLQGGVVQFVLDDSGGSLAVTLRSVILSS